MLVELIAYISAEPFFMVVLTWLVEGHDTVGLDI